MLGIIGAMRVETDALKAMVENATHKTVSGVEFVSGTISGKEVVVAHGFHHHIAQHHHTLFHQNLLSVGAFL